MEGWKCPGCGACYSPYVSKCSRCPGTTFWSVSTNTPVVALCPGCHMPATSPMMASCPMGFHYGTYM